MKQRDLGHELPVRKLLRGTRPAIQFALVASCVALAACTAKPTTSEVQSVLEKQLRKGDTLGNLSCEFFPNDSGGEGRASCIGKVRGIDDRYRVLADGEIIQAIPDMVESKGWPEGMPVATDFLERNRSPVIDKLPKDSSERDLRAEMQYIKTVDAWEFSGDAPYPAFNGATRSEFPSSAILLGSPEWNAYKESVHAKFLDTKAKRDTVRTALDKFFAVGSNAKFGQPGTSAGKTTSPGVMQLTFSGVTWQLLSRSEFFSKGVTGPFYPFQVTATCVWVDKPMNRYRPSVGDAPCGYVDGRTIVIDGTVSPAAGAQIRAYAAGITLQNSSRTSLTWNGDGFVIWNGSMAIWK